MNTPAIRLLATAVLAASALAATLPAAAQAPAANPFAGATRFAGTVQAINNGEYTVRVNDGSTLAFRLAPDARVMIRKAAALADLSAGGFVGCTAVKGTGDALRATECHIFPESMRGAGEGHNPMQAPDTTMTNGNVATMTNGAVQAASGGGNSVRMKVAYKGGEQLIEASAQTEVTQIVPITFDQVKVGTRVNGAARPGPNGGALVAVLNVVP
jgi:hypothetical protein